MNEIHGEQAFTFNANQKGTKEMDLDQKAPDSVRNIPSSHKVEHSKSTDVTGN